jgi:vancomycin resistance protein YoaR
MRRWWLAALAAGFVCATSVCADETFAPDDSTRVSVAAEQEFPVALGSFTTTLSGSLPARTTNIRLAVAALDGAVLEPGDVLSFNAVVGPRSRERGYLDAPVILRETRQLQTGGGVCQVASTVFVAALLSGLDVAERWRHSSPVDYVALGEDATIAWGAKDLRVRNATGVRLRLRVAVTGNALSARFEGADPVETQYELAREERELPADADDGRPGREVTLVRVRREPSGDEHREIVHRDVFPPTQARPR